jgi:hypothetical protein
MESVARVLLALLLPVSTAAAPYPARGAGECWGHSFGDDVSCGVHGNLRAAPRVTDVPPAIAKLFPGKAIRAYRIDLDSDGRPDWIVVEGPPAPQPSRTCFVDSAARIRSCEPSGGDGFTFYWFAQLDGDPMLELFAMEGDDDSSEYRLQKLDPKTWKRRDLFSIDPILLTSEKPASRSFWGYPWDVVDLLLKREGGRILIRAAPRGAARLDIDPGECAGIPEEECGTSGEGANVAVLVLGVPTQEGPPGGFAEAVKASRFVTLDELATLARAPPLKRSRR